MKPSEIKALITARFNAKITRPLHLESSPGVGKTQIAAQVAKELDVGFMVIHAPLLQPEDYGFPVISANKENVEFIVSKSKFPIEGSNCAESGIFLIDELSQADNSAQKILANLIQEREIHGQHIKPGWLIVTTGNRTTDRAGANRLLSHLKNRLTTIEMDASLDDWCNWAFSNGINTEVIAFLRFRPDLLNHFDPQADCNPTPRAWSEGVSAALGVVDSAHEFACFKGDVGEGAAAEFCAFLKIYRKLPSPDAILLNPNGVEVPNDPATLYALCGVLAYKTTGDNFGRVMTYVKRIPQEFSVLYVRDTIKRKPDIQNTPEFTKWACSEGAKLLS
jgi:hypothetical protein